MSLQMSIDCPWSIYSTLLTLTFYIPFKTKHSLLSAGNRWAHLTSDSQMFLNLVSCDFQHELKMAAKTWIWFYTVTTFLHSVRPLTFLHRKYIQVCVQNVSDVNFTLAEVKLTEKEHASLELQSFNAKTHQVRRKI